jgi:RNA ligase
MNYPFPKIRTIDDVLPHIEGYPEFNVNQKDDYIVVNYAVAFEHTFAMDGPDDVAGAIRRECRGLIFRDAGEIMSRPFHKFFNISERAETSPNTLDFSVDHVVMTKEDGSFLRPLMSRGKLRWGTKAGVTEISEIAERFVARNHRYNGFAEWCIYRHLTPIFEYVGPYNKVVLDYAEENMILLAVRENFTGNYLEIHK